ncbi:MAG TPA: undecaprenyl-diphosphatase UppP [Gemmatimonadaceae bacterium]|nr:undecaprenyl-diphosphatase UppP [Gemmatimonadaceae bacterium]
MSVFQAIVLGIVQGLSEFLPISSSAHLRLTPWLLGWPEPGLAFDVALHVGTLIALVWFFWQEWVTLFKAFVGIVRKRRVETESERRFMFVALATIPGAAAGYFLRDLAEDDFRNPVLNGVMLIVMGAILWAVDKYARQDRGLPQMTLKQAMIIGLAQMFAIIPGVSRSGSTITAGRAVGFSREAAAVFSFLMSLPIITAAVVFEGRHAIENGITAPLVAGVIAAAVSGWLAIAVLLKFISRNSYGVFAAYRLVFGGLVLLVAYLRS